MKEHCRPSKPPKPPKPQLQKKPIHKQSLKRKVPDPIRRAIVLLVYGPDTTFTKRIRSLTEVAKIFTISRKTVYSVCAAFKKEQCSIEDFRDKRFDRRSSLESLDPAVKRELLKKDLLQLWATKTLAERVNVIRRDYNVEMTVWKLRKLYIENGIKCRSTQMVYRSQHQRRHELDGERYKFVKRLMSAILGGEPFGYFDEMALHSFLTFKKAWSYADSAVVSPVNSGGRLKVSVYGTISNVLQLPHLDFKYDATNAVDALQYFKKLKAAVAEVTD